MRPVSDGSDVLRFYRPWVVSDMVLRGSVLAVLGKVEATASLVALAEEKQRAPAARSLLESDGFVLMVTQKLLEG